MIVSLETGPFGTYILEAEDGRTILVQTDWDYPGTARLTLARLPRKVG